MKWQRFTEEMIDERHLEALNDRVLMRFSEHHSFSWTKESSAAWLNRELRAGSRVYGIFLEDERAGSFTLRCSSDDVLEVSFLIYSFASGRGLATKILQQCLSLLESSNSLHTIRIGCHRGNMGMRKVALKAGLSQNPNKDSEFLYFESTKSNLG